MKRLTLVVALLLAGSALADARLEAKKRFKQGMSLINDGRYDDGIDALLEAYSIKPHPNVLFNIAKAYESMGRPSEALAYWRRYLASNPPDADKVRASISRLEEKLPAKVAPRTEPENPVRPSSQDPAQVQRLSALADRLEALASKLEGKSAESPQPKKGENVPAELALEGDSEVPYEETVVTASRRAQSTLEAPNATTIITAEEIRMSGANNLPDLLRRVPGAEVMAMGTASANVSFRGFNQRLSNKVLLLVDGRPEYEDFLGLTLWPVIPIGLEEIDRIEIIRGPGSALYGANAMLGVVNIITRAPGTGPRAEANVFGGNGNVAGGSAVASGGETLRYRASVGYQQADKWTRDYDDGRADVAPTFQPSSLGFRGVRGNLVTRYDLNRDISFTAAAGVHRLYTELYPLGLLRNFYIDGLGGYARADASLGPVRVKFFWNHLAASSGPQYQSVGARPLAATVQSNVFDGELLFQKDFSLLGSHRLNVGASGRLKRVSMTYFGGLQQEFHLAAFVQDEWKPIKPVTLVASYRIDRHPLLDKGNPGYAQSPRITALWEPTEGQALRASFATAFRAPTFLESYTNLAVPVPGVDGASVLTTGDKALSPERLISFELGWRGELAKYGIDYDLSLYWNVVSDLISLSAVNPLPVSQSFDARSGSFLLGRSLFFNDPVTYTARGGELGFKWSVLKGLDVRLSTALQSVTSSQTGDCGPCTQAPALKVFLGAQYRTPVDLDLSLDGQLATGSVWVEREPDTVDPTKIINVKNPLPAYVVINARVAYRLWKDKVTIGVVGSQLGPTHQEHPFGNEIQRRVMGTLSVTP